jgi:VIT1/CCC1 family predicted Fe2+/Mn2+ transporter
MLASLIVSTIAFFVASFYIKRYLEKMEIPKGMVRNLSVFVLALAVSYAVGFAVDLVVH